jgi:hypothetical protein
MPVAHPLKRKSVKPSISTVRGMLPGKQFRALDAAMQSLRTSGLRLDWRWKDAENGWVCAGLYNENIFCELLPVFDPLLGQVILTDAQVARAATSDDIPKKFQKVIAEFAIDKKKGRHIYEFVLETSKQRDFFTEFVGILEPLLEAGN